MLEILAETKDPLRVQPHLKKLFEGIAKLHFDSNLVIHAMYSSEGERVYFSVQVDTVEARGCVEKWLLQVRFTVRYDDVHTMISINYADPFRYFGR